ncbi:VC0807 family protein [Amycolatopsis orientalis]|uniref:VC0807 family protein n=1 Tax=Amycolatopsis orientalis TaxID=31958 RepID=UPI0003A8981E|nr:VC0807 family protein [Amycolatopsis orientalis]
MGNEFRSSLAVLLLDLGAPVGGYYLLRAFAVPPVWALLLSGLPPALRVLYTLVTRRRVDGIGLLVLMFLAVGLATTLMTGDARLMLVRGAWFSTLAGVWLLASLVIGQYPTTYQAARALLPGRGSRLDSAWEERPSFRRVWQTLTVAWGVGSLVHSGLSIGMAYTLPVDDVPALDAGLSVAFFVGLQVITQILLLREGTFRQVMRPPTVDSAPGQG